MVNKKHSDTKKVFERSPLKQKLTKALSSLSPNVIVTTASVAVTRMSTLVEILHEKNHISVSTADMVNRLFADMIKQEKFLEACKNLKWNDRLDDFYKIHSSPYPELWNLIKLVLIVSHGNARVEAGFSVNKDMLVPNLKEETLEAHRLVYDAIRIAGGPSKVVITNAMKNSVRFARQRYSRTC